MKRKVIGLFAAGATLALTLGACGSGGGDTPAPESNNDTQSAEPSEGDSAGGFPQDSVIGVSLPWLGTQNWKEAETMFTADLQAAGYTPLVQAADNKAPQQQQQIEAMIEQGAKVIVVGAVDGKQLGSVLEGAKAKGITILAYDRLLEDTDAIDGVVQFGSFRTGELQAEALMQGLKEQHGDGPYNIELFAGGPSDPNAGLFFEGAMSKLQPLIDDGTLVVTSGQTDFTQAATQDWDNSKAQARMDTLLSNYNDKELHGVLSPNDGIARAILTSVQQAGKEQPVVSGLDAENESVTWIWEGKQYSTVAKPTQDLVAETIRLINDLQAGKGLPETSETVNNGVKDVPVYQLDPVIVTRENIEEVFANDPERSALLK